MKSTKPTNIFKLGVKETGQSAPTIKADDMAYLCFGLARSGGQYLITCVADQPAHLCRLTNILFFAR